MCKEQLSLLPTRYFAFCSYLQGRVQCVFFKRFQKLYLHFSIYLVSTLLQFLLTLVNFLSAFFSCFSLSFLLLFQYRLDCSQSDICKAMIPVHVSDAVFIVSLRTSICCSLKSANSFFEIKYRWQKSDTDIFFVL